MIKMSLRIGLTFACALVGAVVVAGCTGHAGAPAGTQPRAGERAP